MCTILADRQTSIGINSKRGLNVTSWLVSSLQQRTTGTLSLRALSVFSQHKEEEDRFYRFHQEVAASIVLCFSHVHEKRMFSMGHTRVYILLSLKCVLSDKVITAFYCFTDQLQPKCLFKPSMLPAMSGHTERWHTKHKTTK